MPAPQSPKPGMNTMTTKLPALKEWVDQVAKLTKPESIHWCNGGSAEYHRLIAEMIEDGTIDRVDGLVAKAEPIQLAPLIAPNVAAAEGVLEAPHFVLYVRVCEYYQEDSGHSYMRELSPYVH